MAWQLFIGLFNDSSSTEFREKGKTGAEICLDAGRKFYIALAAVKVIRDKDFNIN
jgi:hypothetical protein